MSLAATFGLWEFLRKDKRTFEEIEDYCSNKAVCSTKKNLVNKFKLKSLGYNVGEIYDYTSIYDSLKKAVGNQIKFGRTEKKIIEDMHKSVLHTTVLFDLASQKSQEMYDFMKYNDINLKEYDQY